MNYTSDRSVPFEIPNVSHGLKMVTGLLKLKSDGLQLEFEVKDALIGIFSSDVQTVDIPFDKLVEIRYKKGWFSGKVILEGRSMKDFQDIPGTEQATCELKIKRKNRREIENLVSKARAMLSEHKLSKMSEE